MKILVVRSDCAEEITPDLAKLEGEFPQAQWCVAEAPSSFEQALAEAPFALALVPYRLSWTDGFRLMEQLRQRWAGIAVIMVTAQGNEEIAVQGMKAGLSDYLNPASLDRLPQAIQHAHNNSTGPHEPDVATLAMADATDEWEMLVGVDGKYRFISAACEQITGYSPEAFLAEPHLVEKQILHPADLALFTSHHRQPIVSHEQQSEVKFRIIRRDGAVRWICHSRFPVYDPNGHLLGWRVRNRDITEEKRLADELRQRERTLRGMLDAPADSALLLDKDATILVANDTAARSVNQPVEALIGKKFTDFLPPALAEERWVKVLQVFETGETMRFVDQRTGNWYDHLVYPVFDGQGAVTQVAILARDINDYKKAELELQQSYRTIQVLINAPLDVVLLLDPEGRILLANETLAHSLNRPAHEITGKNMRDILPPALAEARWANIRQVFETGQPVRFVDRGVNGWYDNSAYPIFDKQGEVIQVAVVGRDISERIAAEEKLRQNYHTIQALMNGPTDIALLAEPDGKLLMINQTLERLSGKRSEEIAGKTMYELLPSPELAARRIEQFAQVVQSGAPLRFTDYGVDRWLDSVIYPVFDSKGNVIQIAVLARDVSEHVAAQQELKQSYNTIQALLNGPTDIALLIDTQAHVLIANETLANTFGKTPQEMVGLDILEMMPPFMAAQHKKAFDEVIQTGQAVRFQDEGLNGTFDHVVYPILDANGQVQQIAVLARNITDLKQAAETASKNEAILRMVVNTAPLAVLAINAQGKITLADGLALPRMGYSATDLIGRDIFDFLEKNSGMVTMLQQVLAGAPVHNSEFQIGDYRFQASLTPLRDSQDEIIGAACAAFDITAMHKVQVELRQSRDQLKFILSGVADGITAIDAQSQLIYANEAAARRIGFDSLDDYLNSPDTARRLDIRDETGRLIPQHLTPGQRLLHGFANPPVTVRYQRPGSGEERWAVVKDQAVYDEHDNIQMVVTITHDITDLKRTQHALESSRHALEVRVAERTTELDRANQELRNQIARAEALLHIARRLNASLDLRAVLQTICEEAIQALDYSISSVSLYDEPSNSMVIAAAAGNDIELQKQMLPTPRHIYEDFVQMFGTEIVIPDMTTNPEDPNYEIYKQARVHTLIVLVLYEGSELVGSLAVASQDAVRLPNLDELRLLRGLADQASLAITNARLFAQVSDSRQRLRLLSHQLVEAQEAERRRLACELHDEIGQMLTALNMNLDRIEKSERGAPFGSEVQRARETIEQLLFQVRQMSLDLRPPMLDDLGLLPALLTYFERYSDKMKVKIQFSHSGVHQRYPPRIETAAFRIIQEALTNVARHAQVEQANVRLWASSEILGVQVEDDGVGFDLTAAQASGKSSGLSGMQERAELCGGWLEIETHPGGGVCVTAEFPCSTEDQLEEAQDEHTRPYISRQDRNKEPVDVDPSLPGR